MHGSFRVGDSMLGASDGHCKGEANFMGITLTLVLAGCRAIAALFRGAE